MNVWFCLIFAKQHYMPSTPIKLVHSRKLIITMLSFFFFFVGIIKLVFVAMAQQCPLDLSTGPVNILSIAAASACSSNHLNIGKCCRYLNAFVAISVSRYANTTTNLGVHPTLSQTCLTDISQIFRLNGIPENATLFCGLGTKITPTYECKGRTTVGQMIASPKFASVLENCKNTNCKRCLNAGMLYLRPMIGTENNLTLTTCWDATFATLASQVDRPSALNIASCFLGLPDLANFTDSESSQSVLGPQASFSPLVADNPWQTISGGPHDKNRHSYRITLLPIVGIAITAIFSMMLVVFTFLVCRKNTSLDYCKDIDKASAKVSSPPLAIQKFQEGPSSIFWKFSYKETKSATENFKTTIGEGGFGCVYKGQFKDGLVLAVKRMKKVTEKGDDEFCKEIELLAKLHHRHLVALRGFCIEKHERFLMYEFMENGSLKDHLHSPGRSPLSWHTRIQIAIDIANALEYLHFYCDPPLCHRDIKSSNILLDQNFVAKVADFGLVHASKNGSISRIGVTPGYMDPEYVVTKELTEKIDIYGYGVLVLELMTARRAIEEKKNVVEWCEELLLTNCFHSELVDPSIKDTLDLVQLKTMLTIVKWCTQGEGKDRPSIKQVLRILYQSLDDSGEIESTSKSYCSKSFLLEAGLSRTPRTLPCR